MQRMKLSLFRRHGVHWFRFPQEGFQEEGLRSPEEVVTYFKAINGKRTYFPFICVKGGHAELMMGITDDALGVSVVVLEQDLLSEDQLLTGAQWFGGRDHPDGCYALPKGLQERIKETMP